MAYCNGNDCYAQANEQVTFNDSSTNSPTSWNWDFGDGITSTLQNPTHIYTQKGDYTISHTAANSCGSSTCTSKTIHITSTPPPSQPSGIPLEYLAAAGIAAVAVGIVLTSQQQQQSRP